MVLKTDNNGSYMVIISGWWLKNNLEKCEFVNGKDDIPCMKWKIKHVPKSQSYNQWISMVDTEHPTWSIDDWGFPHENSPLIQPTRIMIMSGLHMFTGKICLGINHSKIPRAKKI